MNYVQEATEQGSGRKSAAARQDSLRVRLLDAAEQAIAADGLASLRARSLAEAAGCSVGAIYGVFADLDALVLAVNGRTLAAVDAALASPSPGGPAERLVHLAHAYLDYAGANRARWSALFQHRLPPGTPVTPAYAEAQAAAFRHIEAPLAALQPGLADDARAMLARTLFSAVHGMVELGLDEKVAELPLPVLRAQIETVVRAMAAGLGRP